MGRNFGGILVRVFRRAVPAPRRPAAVVLPIVATVIGASPALAIVRGDIAQPYAWPWHAAVYVAGKNTCGGSLISHRWVLTAAQCVSGRSSAEISVDVGSNDLIDTAGQRLGQKLAIVGAPIIRTGYNHARCMAGTDCSNDIALLRLATPALPRSPDNYPDDLDRKEVGTIGLVTQATAPLLAATGRMAIATGFGLMSPKGERSMKLREVTVALEPCPTTGRKDAVCVFNENSPHSGVCDGDTGGPLVVRRDPANPASSFLQVGIVSTTATPCSRSGYDQYTSVPFHAKWIAEQIGVLYFAWTTFPMKTVLFQAPLTNPNAAIARRELLDIQYGGSPEQTAGNQLTVDPVGGELLYAKFLQPQSNATLLQIKPSGAAKLLLKRQFAIMSPMRTYANATPVDYAWLMRTEYPLNSQLGTVAGNDFSPAGKTLPATGEDETYSTYGLQSAYDPVSNRILYIVPHRRDSPVYKPTQLVAYNLATQASDVLLEIESDNPQINLQNVVVDAAGNIYVGRVSWDTAYPNPFSIKVLMLPVVDGEMPDGSLVVTLATLTTVKNTSDVNRHWSFDNLSNRLIYSEYSTGQGVIKAFDPVTKKKSVLMTVFGEMLDHPLATTR